MKIRSGVLNALRGMTIALAEDTFDVTENHELLINIKGEGAEKIGKIKCNFCANMNFDWCWNCEKPICKSHAYAIKFPVPMIFAVCPECKKALEEHKEAVNFTNEGV